MGDILPFMLRRSKRTRPARPAGANCDVVIFSGVRVDRPRPEAAAEGTRQASLTAPPLVAAAAVATPGLIL